MATTTKFKVNTILWTDLMTPDLEASKKFYGQLFDWQAMDVPTDGGTYTMLSHQNESVGAMMPMCADMLGQNVPPHWSVYIYVEDLEKTMGLIKQHGGQVLCGPMDVMTHGKMATCMDPLGATFNVWQPVQHFGAERMGKDSGMAWQELMSKDIQAALAFYSKVFGWTTEAMPMGDMTYHMMMSGENPVGGGMNLSADMPMPSCWAVYFQVQDIQKMMAKAQEMGASVHMPETAIPGKGSFAFMADPQQAMFYLWQNAK